MQNHFFAPTKYRANLPEPALVALSVCSKPNKTCLLYINPPAYPLADFLLAAYGSLTGGIQNDSSPLAINIEWPVCYLNNCSI